MLRYGKFEFVLFAIFSTTGIFENGLCEAIHHHDDVIKWKNFPRYWPFVRGIHRSQWIPRTKASDAERWCFLWAAPE